MSNVARAWTLAWGTLMGRELPDPIPSEWMPEAAVYDAAAARLRGSDDMTASPDHVLHDLEETLESLETRVLRRVTGCYT